MEFIYLDQHWPECRILSWYFSTACLMHAVDIWAL